MLSFIANIANGITSSLAAKQQGQQYKLQANLARYQGIADRNAAYAQAGNITNAANTNALIANANLRAMEENARSAEGSARVAQGASGFTAEGSGGQNITDAQTYFDTAIANAATEASISSLQSYQTAASTKRQGELAMRQSNIQAKLYESAAKQSNIQARGIMAGTIIGAAVGAYTGNIGYDNAKQSAIDYNTKHGLNAGDAGYINPTGAGLLGFGSAGSWGFGVANMLNPWTAGMTRGMNWGSNMSILMGNTPGIPDNRYSLSGFTGNK